MTNSIKPEDSQFSVKKRKDKKDSSKPKTSGAESFLSTTKYLLLLTEASNINFSLKYSDIQY